MENENINIVPVNETINYKLNSQLQIKKSK